MSKVIQVRSYRTGLLTSKQPDLKPCSESPCSPVSYDIEHMVDVVELLHR